MKFRSPINFRKLGFNPLARQHAGFTLVELLVVLFIIGLLSGLVAVNLATARAEARDNQRRSDLATVATALELYRSQNKSYPNIAVSGENWNQLKAVLYPRFLATWPTDPRGTDGVFGEGYYYTTNGVNEAADMTEAGEHYFLDVPLERETEITAPEVTDSYNEIRELAAFRSGTYQSPATQKIHFRIAR